MALGDSSNGKGIVPSYVDKDWQAMRARLNLAAAHGTAAAISSTTEDVRKQIGMATTMLQDATLILVRLEKGHVPHQHEKWMLQESAKGGMYCAACGEEVPDGSDQEPVDDDRR